MGIRGRKVPPRRAVVLLDRHHPHSASVQCEHPAALRSSAAGSFQAVTPLPPQAPSEESRPSTPRYGFAVVKPGRYSSRPCVIFALRAVLACVPHRCGPSSAKTPQSLPGVQDTAVPAVGADSVSHRRSVRQHTPPPRIRAARHRLRGSARISVVTSCIYSKVCACSRRPLYPASEPVRRSLLWAVPAQAAEAVFPPFAPVSSAAPGSPRSPFRGAPEPAAPTHKTASAATLHFVPRPMALPDS